MDPLLAKFILQVLAAIFSGNAETAARRAREAAERVALDKIARETLG